MSLTNKIVDILVKSRFGNGDFLFGQSRSIPIEADQSGLTVLQRSTKECKKLLESL